MKKILICICAFLSLSVAFNIAYAAPSDDTLLRLPQNDEGYDSMCGALYELVNLSLEKKGILEHKLSKEMLKKHIVDRGQQGEIINAVNDGIDIRGYTAEYLLAGVQGLEDTGVAIDAIYRIDINNRDAVKQAVSTYGGVLISYANTGEYSHNEKNNCYYSGLSVDKANRQAVIVGWRDDFPASEFSHNVSESGAWLIKDSAFNENYCYISYSEGSIGAYGLAVDCVNQEYDKVYQFDGGYTHDNDVSFGHTAYMCNTFISNREEALEYASFFVNTNERVDYEVSVYINPNKKKDPTSGFMVTNRKKDLVVSGSTNGAGYYRIKFKEPIMLTDNDNFAIVVRLKSTENVYIPIDTDGKVKNAAGEDLLLCEANSYEGQSYISMDGVSWEEISLIGNMNVRIKAFTKVVNSPSGNGKLIVAVFIVAIIFGSYFVIYKKKKLS